MSASNATDAPALAKEYRVVRLTREELKEQCKLDDFVMWGAPALELAQYQEEERMQRQTPFSQRGSIFWALVRQSEQHNGDDEGDEGLVPGEDLIFCHCESHRFDCVVRSRNGELTRGFSHHVASVFTLPEFRKQGLATFFLSLVRERLRKLLDALTSVLYSDIGPTYYDKLGWRVYPSTMVTLDVSHPRNGLQSTVAVPAAAGELQRFILDQHLDEFLVADNERLVQHLAGEQYDNQAAFVVLPTRDSIEWQFCVGVHHARVRGYPELPTQCGVRLPGADAFVLWCYNIKESTLYIVRARFSQQSADANVQLLEAALEEARKFQLRKVAIWDPAVELRASELQSRFELAFVERKGSLSSALVFDHSCDNAAAASTLPVWVANEKYAWV